jgi:prepilin-type N-terminal cleavage/methylation domain-containing protein
MNAMKPGKKSSVGFTLIEITIVVGIIGILIAICIPNFMRPSRASQQNVCISNLRLIDGGKRLWALEHVAPPTATPAITDIQPYLGRGPTAGAPLCPSTTSKIFSNSYVIGDIQTLPTCRISTNHFIP